MKLKSRYLIFVCLLATVNINSGCNKIIDKSSLNQIVTTCPEGINLLPIYGNAKKCQQQLDADKKFMEYCLNEFGNLKNASREHASMAWTYLNNGDTDTAMKRFNQAWLLDSLNATAFWGFGCIEGRRGKTDEAIELLKKSIKLDPNITFVWQDLGFTYYTKFQEKFDITYLNLTVENLKKAVQVSPQNEEAYRLLTLAYSHYNQKDSMNKYLKITDKLNPKLIDTETRKNILK